MPILNWRLHNRYKCKVLPLYSCLFSHAQQLHRAFQLGHELPKQLCFGVTIKNGELTWKTYQTCTRYCQGLAPKPSKYFGELSTQ